MQCITQCIMGSSYTHGWCWISTLRTMHINIELDPQLDPLIEKKPALCGTHWDSPKDLCPPNQSSQNRKELTSQVQTLVLTQIRWKWLTWWLFMLSVKTLFAHYNEASYEVSWLDLMNVKHKSHCKNLWSRVRAGDILFHCFKFHFYVCCHFVLRAAVQIFNCNWLQVVHSAALGELQPTAVFSRWRHSRREQVLCLQLLAHHENHYFCLAVVA